MTRGAASSMIFDPPLKITSRAEATHLRKISRVISSLVILSLAILSYNLDDRAALAQLSADAASSTPIDTFNFRGGIGSIVISNDSFIESQQNASFLSASKPPPSDLYIIVGNWTLDVLGGSVKNFKADFIMGLKNGTGMHVHSIGNFRDAVIPSPSKITGTMPSRAISMDVHIDKSNNYSLSLFGSVDVSTNGNFQWKDVPATINIFNGNTISIFLYPSYTDNHFRGMPIYGAVTWLLDADNNPIKPPGFAYG